MEPQSPGVPLVLLDNQNQAPVHVSAGGVNYTTTLATLTRCPESKLAKLFNGTLPISLDPMNFHYFLDVDGMVFTHVLNYLRYDKLLLPHNFDQLPLLLEQAEQLEIEPLVMELNSLMKVAGDLEMGESELEKSDSLKKRTKPRRHKHKRSSMPGNNLLRGLEEGFWGLMKRLEDQTLVDNEGKLGKIIKESEEQRQKSDERMESLMKMYRQFFKRLIEQSEITIEKLVEKIIEKDEDQRHKENEWMDNMMKKHEDCFKKLSLDTEKKNGEHVQGNQSSKAKRR